MGFIPKDAKWYLAELLVKITVEGDPRNVLHTDMVLVRADSPETAHKRALPLGKDNNGAWKNLAGKKVHTRFCGLRDLNVIHDELEHGAEITFQQDIGLTEKQIRKRITPKKRLGVFRPWKPSSGPDYAAGDILRQARALTETWAQRGNKGDSVKDRAGSRSRRNPSRRKRSH
jgi:hypothetical protein